MNCGMSTLIIVYEVFAGKWGNMDETQEYQAKVISTDRNHCCQEPGQRVWEGESWLQSGTTWKKCFFSDLLIYTLHIIKVTLFCLQFYEFWQTYIVCQSRCGIFPSLPKLPRVLFVVHPLPVLPSLGNHWSNFYADSLAFSRMLHK